MHILVLCPHFAPTPHPPVLVMTAIVDGLAERGHSCMSSQRAAVV